MGFSFRPPRRADDAATVHKQLERGAMKEGNELLKARVSLEQEMHRLALDPLGGFNKNDVDFEQRHREYVQSLHQPQSVIDARSPGAECGSGRDSDVG